MGFQTLIRRKTQLALLAAACERHEPARLRVGSQNHSDAEPIDTHLRALEPDGLLLDWNGRQPAPGCVEVRFGHCGEQFVLHAITQGLLDSSVSDGGSSALKLGLPLRVQRRVGRRHRRLSFDRTGPIRAAFQGVTEDRVCFEARLRDISSGGMSVELENRHQKPPPPGTLCWVEFAVPEGEGRFEFVVRLSNVSSAGGRTRLGWVFQPGDDADARERTFDRLEAFVARELSPASTEGIRC